ncbi:MAG: hypothetical protein N2246_01315, partial [Candidatus Sumerlaeia bacterium]|nr:hypothetical protein [Candidatus Sumerlaeia bacterium]
KDAILLDCGDFPSPAVFNETTYYIPPLRVFKEQKFDAITLGQYEVLLGNFYLKKYKELLPDILISNLKIQPQDKNTSPTVMQNLVDPFKIVERGGKKIGIISATDKILAGFITPPPLIPPKDILADLQQCIRQIKHKTDLIILIANLEPSILQQILQTERIPIVINKEIVSDPQSATRVNNSSLICARTKKNAVGILNVTYDFVNANIKQFKYMEEELNIKTEDVSLYLPWDASRKESTVVSERIKRYLPEIGRELPDIKIIERYKLEGKVQEINATAVYLPAVLRQNSKVFAYDVVNNGKLAGRLYFCGYRAGEGGAVFYFMIMFSPDGKVTYFHQTVPAGLGSNFLDMDRLTKSLLNNTVADWKPELAKNNVVRFYEELFVNLIFAIDAVNRYINSHFPLK